MDTENVTTAPPEQSPEPAAPEAAEPTKKHPLRALNFERWALLLAWGVVVLFFSIDKPDIYPTSGNFQTIFGSQAVLLVLALGLIIVLTTGDFDLSIASNMSLSSMIIAVLNTQHHWAILPAIIFAVFISVMIGVINGGLVVLMGVDSFIVTLGMGTIAL